MGNKGRHLYSEVLLLIPNRVLSKGLPIRYCVEPFGPNDDQFFCLGSSLGKKFNSRSTKKDGLVSSKQVLFV